MRQNSHEAQALLPLLLITSVIIIAFDAHAIFTYSTQRSRQVLDKVPDTGQSWPKTMAKFPKKNFLLTYE